MQENVVEILACHTFLISSPRYIVISEYNERSLGISDHLI